MAHNDEESLDPLDWSEARDLAHKMVDDAVAHVSTVRDRPVWTDMPEDIRAQFATGVPSGPASLGAVYDELRSNFLPYSMGNIHPRFWGWYMGAGNFTGALGDFLAAVDGSNLGGGSTAASMIDMQVVDWLKEIVGFPESASGTLTSGGSVANLLAHVVARNTRAGVDVRKDGIANLPKPLRFYTSDQAHSCHQKALEILGLGSKSLRYIQTDDQFSIDIEALRAAINDDLADGWQPVCVIGTAGTTNTGALDDLNALADLCEEFDLLFHVDGCIGAFVKLAPANKHLVSGIERANSVALDPHKWMHAPFEAGCFITKDAKGHFESFEMHGEYLQLQTRGLIKGKFLADYGIELSRGLKALKIWMSLKENGTEKFGRLIDQNIAQARHLKKLVGKTETLELVAPVPLNIVCFRFNPGSTNEDLLKAVNTEIMLRIQESGLAIPSDTTVQGKHCLRVAINNHRTRRDDLQLLVDAVVATGNAVWSEQSKDER